MAWWGKLVGGTLGFMLGGPLGALLGVSFGHNFDNRDPQVGARRALPGDQERVQAAFFTATFSIMGHISKSDGRVSEDEIQIANAVMTEMQLDAGQRKLARNLFNRGKADDFDFEAVVQQLHDECARRTNLLRMFIEIQVQAAFADQHLDPGESSVLQRMVEILGLPASELERIIDMVRGARHSTGQAGARDLADAYAVLGVSAQTPLDEIKKAYRRLRSQHHPDKLVSKGLPEEMIKLANEKTHEIQQAWQTVRDHRTA